MLESFYNKYIELNLNDFFEIGFDFKINKVLFFAFLGIVIACIITNYVESGISVALKRLLRTETNSEDTAKTLAELGLKDSRCARLSLARRGGMTARLILVAGEKRPTYEEYIAEQKELKARRRLRRKERFFSFLAKLGISKKEKPSADESNNKSEMSIPESSDTNAIINKDTEGSKDSSEARYYIPEDMMENAKRYLERHSPTVTRTVISCVFIMVFYVALVYLMPTFIDLILALM